MLSSTTSIAKLTRQMAQFSIVKSKFAVGASSAPPFRSCGGLLPGTVSSAANLTSSFSASSTTANIMLRGFATNRKVIDAKNAKRLKVQAKKKKNVAPMKAASTTSEDHTGADTTSSDPQQPFLQHQEWVKFQQSITVDGFQTGQVVNAAVVKKSRGGKQARKRREKELALSSPTTGSTSTISQKFPALRYSEEETQELLQLAFDSLPKRDGKRGTRNQKRQNQRWKTVRSIRATYKRQLQQAHERRMEKRSWKRQQTKYIKEEVAPTQRQQDQQYQAQVLQKWAQIMFHSQTGQQQQQQQKAEQSNTGTGE